MMATQANFYNELKPVEVVEGVAEEVKEEVKEEVEPEEPAAE